MERMNLMNNRAMYFCIARLLFNTFYTNVIFLIISVSQNEKNFYKIIHFKAKPIVCVFFDGIIALM